MNSSAALLLSLKPRFADEIFAGRKSVELRRRRPRVKSGQLIVIYVTAPRMAVEGFATVTRIHEDEPSALWDRVKRKAGVSKIEFGEYFKSCERAYAIEITKRTKLSKAMALGTIRESIAGFHPPQSYQYLSEEELLVLIGSKRSRG